MTIQGSFVRRGRSEPRQTQVFVMREEPREEARPSRPKMTLGQIAIGVIGILAGISILSHSNQDGQRAAALQPAATATVQKAVPRKCGATLREYEALQVGISLGQAIGIVGCKGTELSRVAYGGQESVMVSWPGEGGLFSNMNATFDNDRLVAKGQLGLE